MLLGGTLLPALGVDHRSTMDIDIAGTEERTMADTLVLMDLAEELGLPVEAINTAAAFCLHRLRGFRRLLLPLRDGKHGRILRPNFELYARLKAERLTETDLADVRAYLDYARRHGEPIPAARLIRRLRAQGTAGRPNSARSARLAALIAALGRV